LKKAGRLLCVTGTLSVPGHGDVKFKLLTCTASALEGIMFWGALMKIMERGLMWWLDNASLRRPDKAGPPGG